MRLFAVFLLAVSVISAHWPRLSFDMVQTSFRSPAIIGVACAAISACGFDLGKALSRRCVFSGRAEALGLTLQVIACNILRQHNVFDEEQTNSARAHDPWRARGKRSPYVHRQRQISGRPARGVRA